MSHFAKVLDGQVIEVIAAEADFFHTFRDTSPGTWIQTSYNTRGNVHYGADGQPDGGTALRGNYAGIGMLYDQAQDVFYARQPYPSWTLNTQTWTWSAPVPYPEDGTVYSWNEADQAWKPFNTNT
jgi:hypothetical protein